MQKGTKVFIVFTLLIFIVMFNKHYSDYKNKEQLKIQIVKEEALSLSTFMMAFRQTYQKTFIKNHILIDEKNINFLPVITTTDIGDIFSQSINNKVTIKTVSSRPRNPINKANDQEMKIINYFNTNKNKKSYFEDTDGEVFYYANPLYIDKTCLKCHGKKENALKIIKDNYDTAYDYKLGELRGILSIKLTKNDLVKQIDTKYITDLKISILVYCLFLLSLYIMIRIIVKNEKKYGIQLEKEIKLKTKEVKEEKEYIQTIVESNNNAIIAIDWSGKITTYNKKAQEIFGWTKEEMIGSRNLLNIIPDKYKKQHIEALANYFKIGKLSGILDNAHQAEGLNKNGNIFPIRISVASKFQFQNTIVIANISDISQEKKQEELIYQQTKMVAMGEMIGNIAHQWRQPLSVISTAATGMQVQKEYGHLNDEQFDEACKMIDNNAQYLSKTIDDFTNYIKNDRTKEIFNLTDDINSFLQLVNGSIKNHHLKIILDLQDDIKIDGFQNELTQCLINIFNNSKDVLKEIDEEDRFIFISTLNKNDKAILTIKDSGGGIPEDILPKIFEPYFTTKHQSQGTGLGLHMTYNLIVDGMGGTIKASNISYNYNDKHYIGAEFKVIIPI